METTARRSVEAQYRESWGWMAARGVLAILFGIFMLAWPGFGLLALVVTIASYTIVDGVATLVFAGRGGTTEAGKTWPLVLTGLLGVAAGIVIFAWPGLGTSALLFIVAVWAIARGIAEIVAYFPLRREMGSSWLLLVSGLLSVAFGVILFSAPVAGILSLIWLVGLYAVIVGISLIGWSVAMKRAKGPSEEPTGPPPSEPTPA